jgi:phosphohistidine swiveling domain-containing protein
MTKLYHSQLIVSTPLPYGIPAVSGCVEATKKIKTGDKIRVDGDHGVVYILG